MAAAISSEDSVASTCSEVRSSISRNVFVWLQTLFSLGSRVEETTKNWPGLPSTAQMNICDSWERPGKMRIVICSVPKCNGLESLHWSQSTGKTESRTTEYLSETRSPVESGRAEATGKSSEILAAHARMQRMYLIGCSKFTCGAR